MYLLEPETLKEKCPRTFEFLEKLEEAFNKKYESSDSFKSPEIDKLYDQEILQANYSKTKAKTM